MPTFVHGKNAVIKISDSAGALYDLSPITDSAENPRSLGNAEVTHFGSVAKEFIVGLSDSTLSISGKFDAAIDLKINAAMDALIAGTNAAMLYEYHPAGTATGTPKYAGSFIPTNYTVSAPVDGAVTIKLEGQCTGARTRTTNP
jgi:hypothetical protein